MMLRERGLAETRRSEDERVIQRLAALDRRLHEDLHLRLDLLLSDVVGELLRPDGAIDGLLFLRGRGLHDAIRRHAFGGVMRAPRPASARRISSSVVPPEPAKGFSMLRDLGGLVAERDQRAQRFALGLRGAIRQRRAGGGGLRERVESVAHLDEQAFGGLAADAGNARQRRRVLHLHAGREPSTLTPKGSPARCSARRPRP